MEAAKAEPDEEGTVQPIVRQQQSTSKEQMRTVDKIIMNVLQKVGRHCSFLLPCTETMGLPEEAVEIMS